MREVFGCGGAAVASTGSATVAPPQQTGITDATTITALTDDSKVVLQSFDGTYHRPGGPE